MRGFFRSATARFDAPRNLSFVRTERVTQDTMSLAIYKLGGSLLTCASLAGRLRSLLQQTDARSLIVVGGGTAADVVRNWSQLYQLEQEPAHWIAVRSLALTRSLVQRLLPECEEAASHQQANAHWERRRTPVLLDVEACLRHAERDDLQPLPHTWDVTSDSIAAWAASRWSADDLILLKSIGLPPDMNLQSAAAEGLVDEHFPKIAATLPRIRWCNLSDDTPIVEDWLQHGRRI